MSPIPTPSISFLNRQALGCRPCDLTALLMPSSTLLPESGWSLDLACGYGRNTSSLARRGLRTTGIDRSCESLVAGRKAASQANMNIGNIKVGLTSFALPLDSFSIETCFRYRNPDLYLPNRAVLSLGVFIFANYTSEHLKFALKPHNPAHLFDRNELPNAFDDWQIIFYRKVWKGRGIASLGARKPGQGTEC